MEYPPQNFDPPNPTAFPPPVFGAYPNQTPFPPPEIPSYQGATAIEISVSESHNVQEDTFFKEPRYCFGKSRYPIHVLSLVFNFLLFFGLVTIAFTAVLSSTHLFWIGLVIAYIAYWVEALLSSSCRYLRHIKRGEDILAYLQQMRKTPPVVWIQAICYHFESRTRVINKTVSETESVYNSTTNRFENKTTTRIVPTTETYEEKVISYNKKKIIKIHHWEDVSGEMSSDFISYPILKLHFSKSIEFSDHHSEDKYKHKRDKFYNKCVTRDRFLDFSEGMDVHGFKSNIISVQPTAKVSKMFSLPGFLLATLVWLSWPYRLWMDRQCFEAKLLVRKTIRL